MSDLNPSASASSPPDAGTPAPGTGAPSWLTACSWARVSWTAQDIVDYRAWVQREAPRQGERLGKIDCADLALVMLVRFARERELPLRFTKVGTGDLGSLRQQLTGGASHAVGGFGRGLGQADHDYFVGDSWRFFEDWARRNLGGRDLLQLGFDQVLPVVDLTRALPGDMLALAAQRSDGMHRHIQLVLDNGALIPVPDAAGATAQVRVLEVLQGNLPAADVARAAWGLDDDLYYRFESGRWAADTEDSPGSLRRLWGDTVFGRRWNFAYFNTRP